MESGGDVTEGLSGGEREAYRAHGFAVRPGVLVRTELEPLREAVERIHERICHAARGGPPAEWVDDKRYQRLLGSLVKWEWSAGSREIRSMEPFHHLDPCIDALIDDPRLWGPARELVKSDSLALFTDKLNYKRPGGSPFPWHQDSPYWAFGCTHLDRLASLQVYLDDATVDNGCLWMIPGSHRHGPLPVYEDRGVLGRLYTDVDHLELVDAVPIEAPAGSVIYFHGDVVHGSKGNGSRASRRAIVLTYQPAGHPRWNEPAERLIAQPELA